MCALSGLGRAAIRFFHHVVFRHTACDPAARSRSDWREHLTMTPVKQWHLWYIQVAFARSPEYQLRVAQFLNLSRLSRPDFWSDAKTLTHVPCSDIFQSIWIEIFVSEAVQRPAEADTSYFGWFWTISGRVLKIRDFGICLWAGCSTFQIGLTHKSSYKLKIQDHLKASALDFFSECDCASQGTGLINFYQLFYQNFM